MTAAKRLAGRPTSPPTTPAMIRLTEPQRAKFLELGGSRWVKRLLNEAIDLAIEQTKGKS